HVWPLHRLDRGTSGIVMFAPGAQTSREYCIALLLGAIEKRYVALVRCPAHDQLLVDYAFRRINPVSGDKTPARSEDHRLRRLGEFERYSLVEARPLTGRTHQIRRHLKHIAHPIIGDVRYGKGAHNRLFRERFGLHRLALHAVELRFGELTIRAPLTEDFAG